MKSSKNKNHGGVRKGAGRKTLNETDETVRTTITLTTTDLEKLCKIDTNISAAIRQLVARYSK